MPAEQFGEKFQPRRLQSPSEPQENQRWKAEDNGSRISIRNSSLGSRQLVSRDSRFSQTADLPYSETDAGYHQSNKHNKKWHRPFLERPRPNPDHVTSIGHAEPRDEGVAQACEPRRTR